MICWAKRPRRSVTVVAKVAVWHSIDRKFRVEKHVYNVSLPTTWFAMIEDRNTYDIISRHRSRTAAIRACERANNGKKHQAMAGGANSRGRNTARVTHGGNLQVRARRMAARGK